MTVQIIFKIQKLFYLDEPGLDGDERGGDAIRK